MLSNLHESIADTEDLSSCSGEVGSRARSLNRYKAIEGTGELAARRKAAICMESVAKARRRDFIPGAPFFLVEYRLRPRHGNGSVVRELACPANADWTILAWNAVLSRIMIVGITSKWRLLVLRQVRHFFCFQVYDKKAKNCPSLSLIFWDFVG